MFILNKLHPIRLSYKVIKLAVKFERLIFRSKTNYKQHMMSKIVFYLFAVYCKTMAMNHLHFSYVSIDIFTNQSIGQKPTTRWGHSNLMKLPWYRLYNCLQKLISFVCFQNFIAIITGEIKMPLVLPGRDKRADILWIRFLNRFIENKIMLYHVNDCCVVLNNKLDMYMGSNKKYVTDNTTFVKYEGTYYLNYWQQL